MNRLVESLLLTFRLVSNAFAYSHGCAAHPTANHGRAHIHIGSASLHGHHSHESDDHHHGHDHESEEHESARLTSCEHNSDAIYLASAGDA